jgi:triacylglycerol lipase
VPTWQLIVAASLLLLAVGGGVLALWLRRRARRRRPALPPRIKYPVVLAHGLMGFDSMKVRGFKKVEYFRGVPQRLRRVGAEVYVVRVPPALGVAARAEELARAVRLLDAKRVNIIAHSMGGLDARYAIARLNLGDKVASLTTIGTPHRGTPLADLGTNVLGEKLGLRWLLSNLGVELDAFYDLTTRKMEAFNREVPDARGIAYGSFVASVQAKRSGINPLLRPAHAFLNERAGENDGVVPVSSQRWGEVLGTVDADHWAQIGWSKGFDAPAFYVDLLKELRGRGL